jgi:putative hydrolase of the HAD superfamily
MERDYVHSGFDAVARWAEKALGVPHASGYSRLIALFERGVRGSTFDDWLSEEGIEAAGAIEQMVEIYRKHEPRIAAAAGVEELLVRLHRRYALGLITDGATAVQRGKLRALGLEALFDATLVTDELGLGRSGWKPSRAPFEEILGRLSVAPADAVYVADNPAKDFIAPRALGMRSIRLRAPGGIYGSLAPATQAHASDLEIASLDALESALEQLTPALR